MSVKIFNGFLMKECSMSHLKNFIEIYKKEVFQIATNRFNEFIKNVVKEDSSEQSVKEKESKAFTLWMQRREDIDLKEKNDPFVDISCELLFIPVEVDNQQYLAGMLFTKNKDMLDLWMNKENVLSFSYTDQSDKPEDISNEDWMFRKKVWSVLSDEIISMQGFSFEVLSKRMVFPF